MEQYWLTFVKGHFWTSKTYWTFLNAFMEKLSKWDSKPYIFANVPYSITDCFYSTTDDLKQVFDLLVDYCVKTNHNIENYFNSKSNLRDIVIIVDEAHRYFDAREFAKLLSNYKTIITQCRKRNIKIILITQKLTSCDIIFRRLADYTKEYKKYRLWIWSLTFLEWVRWYEYENPWGDLADIESEQKITVMNNDWYEPNKNLLIDSWFFTPMTSILQIKDILFNKAYQLADKERFNSYYISWFEDWRVNIPSLQEFENSLIIPNKKEILEQKKDLQKKQENKKQDYFKRLDELKQIENK